MNRFFFLCLARYFLILQALTLEKYQRSVHIFNLQIRINAINILAQICMRLIATNALLRCQ
jgi:hypothetical protein